MIAIYLIYSMFFLWRKVNMIQSDVQLQLLKALEAKNYNNIEVTSV